MPWSGTAIWICPALCGCRLSIAADWVNQPEPGSDISYQHPIPGTIRMVQIDAVCVAHDHFRTDPLPADPYGGAPGYLTPIPPSPTDAEKLYAQLYRYAGQRFRPDTCGCHIAQCVDRLGVEATKVHAHPKHTRKCQHHLADDDQHTAALEEVGRKNQAVNKLKQRFSHLADDDIQWSFDSARMLHIQTPKLNPGEKVAAQADHDPARVVIE